MRSAALPRFSSKIPGFISYVILRNELKSHEKGEAEMLPQRTIYSSAWLRFLIGILKFKEVRRYVILAEWIAHPVFWHQNPL